MKVMVLVQAGSSRRPRSDFGGEDRREVTSGHSGRACEKRREERTLNDWERAR